MIGQNPCSSVPLVVEPLQPCLPLPQIHENTTPGATSPTALPLFWSCKKLCAARTLYWEVAHSGEKKNCPDKCSVHLLFKSQIILSVYFIQVFGSQNSHFFRCKINGHHMGSSNLRSQFYSHVASCSLIVLTLYIYC